MAIHSTAVVHPEARLDKSVEVGPYAVIGAQVSIGPKTVVGPHAVIEGRTTIGANNRIFQFASVGAAPQDLKYAGEDTEVVIGDHNAIREFSTIHRGTVQGGSKTVIGNHCLLMASSHVAHDCLVGNHVILANSAALAGHCTVEDGVICGGLSGVHQFTRLGRLAFVSGGAMVTMDVAPYCTVQGDRAELAGLNSVGLTRAGFTTEQVSRVKAAYKTLFRSGLSLKDALATLREELSGHSEIEHLVRFIEGSERGILR